MVTIKLPDAEGEILSYVILDEIKRVAQLQTELQDMGIRSNSLNDRMISLQIMLKDVTNALKGEKRIEL